MLNGVGSEIKARFIILPQHLRHECVPETLNIITVLVYSPIISWPSPGISQPHDHHRQNERYTALLLRDIPSPIPIPPPSNINTAIHIRPDRLFCWQPRSISSSVYFNRSLVPLSLIYQPFQNLVVLLYPAQAWRSKPSPHPIPGSSPPAAPSWRSMRLASPC